MLNHESWPHKDAAISGTYIDLETGRTMRNDIESGDGSSFTLRVMKLRSREFIVDKRKCCRPVNGALPSYLFDLRVRALQEGDRDRRELIETVIAYILAVYAEDLIVCRALVSETDSIIANLEEGMQAAFDGAILVEQVLDAFAEAVRSLHYRTGTL